MRSSVDTQLVKSMPFNFFHFPFTKPRIQGTDIYFHIKCRWICHTWILWVLETRLVLFQRCFSLLPQTLGNWSNLTTFRTIFAWGATLSSTSTRISGLEKNTGFSTWMISTWKDLYIKNCCFNKHPLNKWFFGVPGPGCPFFEDIDLDWTWSPSIF